MGQNQNTMDPICEDCQALIGGSRHTPPHKNLISTGYKPFPSMFGSVDEHYYTCKKCGKTWLHETGSYGEGWT